MQKLTQKDLSLTFSREAGKTKIGRPKFKFLPTWIKNKSEREPMFTNMSEFIVSAGMTLYFWQCVDSFYSKDQLKNLNEKDFELLAQKFCDEINNRNFSLIKKRHIDSIMIKYYSDICVAANMYEDEVMDEYAQKHFPPPLLEIDLDSLKNDTKKSKQKEDFEMYTESSYAYYEKTLADIASIMDPILLWGEDRGLIEDDFSFDIDEQLDLFKDAYDAAEDYEEGGVELECVDEAYLLSEHKLDNFYDNTPVDNEESYPIGNYAVSEFKDGERTLQLDAEKYGRALLYKIKNPHERDFQLLSTGIHDDENQEMLMQYTFLDWLQKSGKINDTLLDKKFKFVDVMNYVVSQSECTTYTLQLLAKTVERPENRYMEENDFIRFFMEFTSHVAHPTSLRDYELGQNALEAILFIGFCAYVENNPKADAVVIIKGYNENKILKHKVGKKIIEVPEQEAYHFWLEKGEICGMSQEKAEKINAFDPEYDSEEEEALDLGVVVKDTQELLAQKSTQDLIKQLRFSGSSPAKPKMS